MTAFSRPQTPAAKCLHIIRLQELTSRSELVNITGLSQPTITRAISALSAAGYVRERTDLTHAAGRGRPIIPIELGEPEAMHAGVAVGTMSTYIALFDIKGRTLRSVDLDIPVARMSHDDFVQHIMAGINRLTAGIQRPLSTVGVTTSGAVNEVGEVYAANLGWRGVAIGAQMREQFSVPVEVASISQAIVGSELQSSRELESSPIMALFADDSIACAISDKTGVNAVDVSREDLTTQGLLDSIGNQSVSTLTEAVKSGHRAELDERARGLGTLAAELASVYSPSTVVIAGSAFIDDPHAPTPFAQAVRETATNKLELRMIPTHREVVRDIARAIALDSVLSEPLKINEMALHR